MAIFKRLLDLKRAWTLLGRRGAYRDSDEWFWDDFARGNSVSGEHVTQRNALGYAAYFDCIRNISEDVAVMPRDVLERKGPMRIEHSDHPIWYRLNVRPNDSEDMTAQSFFEALVAHALAYHGGFAEIQLYGGVQPVGLWLLDPSTVKVFRAGNRTMYQIGEGANKRVLPPERVFHIHGLGYDGLTGYVMSEIQKETIGTAIATLKFRGAFFGNGAVLTGGIEIPENMSPEGKEHLKKTFYERHAGSAEKQHGLLLMEEGLKWVQISPDPQKSQMTESFQSDVVTMCGLFRMPPQKLQYLKDTTTNATASEIARDYAVDCLTPWCRRIDAEARIKLFLPTKERTYYVKTNLDSRLQGDPEKRAANLKSGFDIGKYSINDLLSLDDRNPLPHAWADEHWLNGAYAPARLLAVAPMNKPQDAAQGQDPNAPDEDNGIESITVIPRPKADDAARAIIAELQEAFADKLISILSIEHNNVIRAAKQEAGLAEWLKRYYPKHREYVAQKMRPVVRAIAIACGITEPDMLKEIVGQVADNHVKLSIAELGASKSGIDIGHWTSTRPTIEASQQIERIQEYARQDNRKTQEAVAKQEG